MIIQLFCQRGVILALAFFTIFGGDWDDLAKLAVPTLILAAVFIILNIYQF